MPEEIFIKAPSTHKFYKRCMKYHREDKNVFKKAQEYLAPYGIPKKEVALGWHNVGIIDKPKYRKRFKGLYKIDEGYLIFKRNTKIGKGWKLERPIHPLICFELDAGNFAGHFRETKFIFNDTLYARVMNSSPKVPEGFTEIPSSEFYLLVERINKEKLDHISI